MIEGVEQRGCQVGHPIGAQGHFALETPERVESVAVGILQPDPVAGHPVAEYGLIDLQQGDGRLLQAASAAYDQYPAVGNPEELPGRIDGGEPRGARCVEGLRVVQKHPAARYVHHLLECVEVRHVDAEVRRNDQQRTLLRRVGEVEPVRPEARVHLVGPPCGSRILHCLVDHRADVARHQYVRYPVGSYQLRYRTAAVVEPPAVGEVRHGAPGRRLGPGEIYREETAVGLAGSWNLRHVHPPSMRHGLHRHGPPQAGSSPRSSAPWQG
ncbi:MAG: hypothetical protein BWX47_02100 [candidate division Hyd24-12 bacterium ADurb.Bin004]|nr:MAG: hypothetical protein BWX47_02100 [candidate division Hyd24-12 bacterium ADurb.Bin004]